MISYYIARARLALAEAMSGNTPDLSTRELFRIYGDPGTVAEPNTEWERDSISTYRDLPGVPRKWYFKFHRRVEPFLRHGLREAALVSPYRIERAGGYVLRHQRHDPKRPLSIHSLGLAVDVDAGRNSARSFRRGKCPAPWSPEWMALWPHGVDRAFVEAMERAGFLWGGVWGKRRSDFAVRARATTFADPMHFEYRRRDGR